MSAEITNKLLAAGFVRDFGAEFRWDNSNGFVDVGQNLEFDPIGAPGLFTLQLSPDVSQDAFRTLIYTQGIDLNSRYAVATNANAPDFRDFTEILVQLSNNDVLGTRSFYIAVFETVAVVTGV